MRIKRAWTFQSLLICIVFNGMLLAGVFMLSRHALSWLHQWSAPYLGTGGVDLPEQLKLAFANLNQVIAQTEIYLAVVAFGIGGAITLILWFFVQLRARRLLDRAGREALTHIGPSGEISETEAELPTQKQRYAQSSPEAAIQMLSILQRQGRLVDFLQEDLSLYNDAQIGAAVRNIHQGCKDALEEYVKLQPVFDEEGIEVTVPSGFDSRSIRLTGNVAGDPPFQGIVRHRGWRVLSVELPQPVGQQKEDWILAPAEVEIEE